MVSQQIAGRTLRAGQVDGFAAGVEQRASDVDVPSQYAAHLPERYQHA